MTKTSLQTNHGWCIQHKILYSSTSMVKRPNGRPGCLVYELSSQLPGPSGLLDSRVVLLPWTLNRVFTGYGWRSTVCFDVGNPVVSGQMMMNHRRQWITGKVEVENRKTIVHIVNFTVHHFLTVPPSLITLFFVMAPIAYYLNIHLCSAYICPRGTTLIDSGQVD